MNKTSKKLTEEINLCVNNWVKWVCRLKLKCSDQMSLWLQAPHPEKFAKEPSPILNGGPAGDNADESKAVENQLALAFANRSAAFYHRKKFHLALQVEKKNNNNKFCFIHLPPLEICDLLRRGGKVNCLSWMCFCVFCVLNSYYFFFFFFRNVFFFRT